MVPHYEEKLERSAIIRFQAGAESSWKKFLNAVNTYETAIMQNKSRREALSNAGVNAAMVRPLEKKTHSWKLRYHSNPSVPFESRYPKALRPAWSHKIKQLQAIASQATPKHHRSDWQINMFEPQRLHKWFWIQRNPKFSLQ